MSDAMAKAFTAAKVGHPLPMQTYRNFILDIVMISKNRGMSYREGMAGMAAAVKFMNLTRSSLRKGDEFTEQQ